MPKFRAHIKMGAYITLMLLILSLICIQFSSGRQPSVTTAGFQDQHYPPGEIIDRVGPGTGFECSKDVILLYQDQTSPLPSGIPTYTVQIINNCITGGNDDGRCNVSNIHVSCGWFSTARSINPVIFRRIDYDDCLVNDGQPMNAGQCVTFQYANTFAYPLSVSYVSC